MNQSRENLAYHIINAAINALAIIPRRRLVRLAVPLGKIWYGLDHYHRRIAYENMWHAFKQEKNSVELKQMVRANFVQLVRMVLEIPSLLKLNRNNIDTYVEIHGQHHLEKALSQGRGVLMITAHLGNWELLGLPISLKFGLPLTVLVRPLDFSPMDRVITAIRSRTGNRMLDKDKSAAEVSGLLQNNQIVGILMDQNSSWYEGVYTPFFGRTACTNKGPAMLAMRYNAVVVPIFNVRQKDGRYRIIINPPVDLVRSGNISADIIANTARFNQIIETHIRMAPDNWLWVHRRWRIKEIPARAKKKLKGIPV